MPFLRQSYKQKPKQWGPFSAVQSALFHNLESIGIDPYSMKLAIPGWENAGSIAHNYAKNIVTELKSGAAWDRGITCMTDLSHIDTNLTVLDLLRNDDNTKTVGSFIFQYQQVNIDHQYCYLINTSGVYSNFSFTLDTSSNEVYGLITSSTKKLVGSGLPEYNAMVSGRDVLFGGSLSEGALANFIVDGKSRTSTWTMPSLASYTSSEIYYGGRNESAARYSGAIFGPILAANTAWTPDQLLALNDGIYRLFQPVPQKTIFLPSGSIPSGWKHKINLIAPANVHEINGVSFSNINSVNGVE